MRAAAVMLVAVIVGVLAARTHRLYDFTSERSLTLTDQSRAVVARLHKPVQITAFVRRDEPGRVEAVALLARYRDLSRRLSWRVVDPDDAPGEMARLGVDPIFGGVALVAGREVERVPAVTEQDVTSALARLQRAQPAEVCFTTGHGEGEYAQARALLEREGYRLRTIDLLTQPRPHDDCAAVILAGPTVQPAVDAIVALRAWLNGDGKLLVLSDPAASADTDLTLVLAPMGASLRRGVVFEGDAQSVINADVTAPVVRTYSSAHPIVRRLAPTYFPGVQAVEVDEGAESDLPGLTLSRLADTSPASYLETEPLTAEFDAQADKPGPITVAAAADRSQNDGRRITRSRLVVVGDADFASDLFLRQAGNASLLLRSVEWLTTGEAEAAISANLPADRPLGLTDARVTYARLVTAGLVPTLFLLAGAIAWAARRNR